MHNGFKGGSAEITAQQITARFHIPYSTLNHYTNLGIFSIVKKSGNRRIYNAREIQSRYHVLSKLVTQGYPLSLIRRKITNR